MVTSFRFFPYFLLVLIISAPSCLIGSLLDLSLLSPLEQEVAGGTIVTASFVIKNTSTKQESLFIEFTLPPQWETIPFEEPFFTLDPGETVVKLIAFKVPTRAPSGSYPITCTVRGQSNPSLMKEQPFFLYVLPHSEISASIVTVPKRALAGEPYSITLELSNSGNIENTITVGVEDFFSYPFTISPSSFTLSPGNKALVTITSYPKEDIKNLFMHILSIGINVDGIKKEDLIAQVEIFPVTPKKTAKYLTLPMESSLGFGKKNSRSQLFFEQSGGGALPNDRFLYLYAQIPIIEKAPVYRDLGGPPETAYLHYKDPKVDLYGGSGVYSLTPLTMLNSFGSGASVTLFPGIFTAKGLFVRNTSSVPLKAYGASVGYTPNASLAVSLTTMQTQTTSDALTTPLPRGKKLTNSLFTKWSHKKAGTIQAEYADTGGFFAHKKQMQSYYLYAFGSPTKETWYALQGIYAAPKFVGYYEDTAQIYGSLGFPFSKKLRGTLAHNTIRYNLAKNPSKLNAQTIFSSYGGLSYTFQSGLYTSLYYNQDTAKDSLSNQGYRSSFGSLSGGQSFSKWTVQGIGEYGRYHPIALYSKDKVWQNYQLYLYYQPSSEQQYAAYTRLGYQQIASTITWTSLYGITLTRSWKKNCNLQLLYELSTKQQYASARALYTFSNRSFASFKGYWNKQEGEKGTIEFLFSYTIPWQLPYAKNKKVGEIKGTAFYEEQKQILPAPGLVVNCGQHKTLTNKKGEFSFPDLPPGDYHLWAEEGDFHAVSPLTKPTKVSIKGGTIENLPIRFTHPSTITGMVCFSPDKVLKKALVFIRSTATGETRSLPTDGKGRFSFDKLPPGRWIISLDKNAVPSFHTLAEEEILVDLFPGEERSVAINILPIKRPIRIIDVDTLKENK